MSDLINEPWNVVGYWWDNLLTGFGLGKSVVAILQFVLLAWLAVQAIRKNREGKAPLEDPKVKYGAFLLVGSVVFCTVVVAPYVKQRDHRDRADRAEAMLSNQLAKPATFTAEDVRARRELEAAKAELRATQDSQRQLAERLDLILRYGEIAKLSVNGSLAGPGSDVIIQTPISDLMNRTIVRKQTGWTFLTTGEAETLYRTLIQQHPEFPFAYVGLAETLRKKEDDAVWRDYATNAVDILTKTTQVPGHHVHHDQVLRQLREMLADPAEKK